MLFDFSAIIHSRMPSLDKYFVLRTVLGDEYITEKKTFVELSIWTRHLDKRKAASGSIIVGIMLGTAECYSNVWQGPQCGQG